MILVGLINALPEDTTPAGRVTLHPAFTRLSDRWLRTASSHQSFIHLNSCGSGAGYRSTLRSRQLYKTRKGKAAASFYFIFLRKCNVQSPSLTKHTSTKSWEFYLSAPQRPPVSTSLISLISWRTWPACVSVEPISGTRCPLWRERNK